MGKHARPFAGSRGVFDAGCCIPPELQVSRHARPELLSLTASVASPSHSACDMSSPQPSGSSTALTLMRLTVRLRQLERSSSLLVAVRRDGHRIVGDVSRGHIKKSQLTNPCGSETACRGGHFWHAVSLPQGLVSLCASKEWWADWLLWRVARKGSGGSGRASGRDHWPLGVRSVGWSGPGGRGPKNPPQEREMDLGIRMPV